MESEKQFKGAEWRTYVLEVIGLLILAVKSNGQKLTRNQWSLINDAIDEIELDAENEQRARSTKDVN